MKHTKKYLDAMWVIENPDKYDAHDVLDAKRYTNAYIEGYTQALLIADVVGQSEQLKAFILDYINEFEQEGTTGWERYNKAKELFKNV